MTPVCVSQHKDAGTKTFTGGSRQCFASRLALVGVHSDFLAHLVLWPHGRRKLQVLLWLELIAWLTLCARDVLLLARASGFMECDLSF